MTNDEKIDINLGQNTKEGQSAEVRAKKHYETAQRYINIAEHMNKFEDQSKYYHRSIKYLKLSLSAIKELPQTQETRAEIKKLRIQIREMRQKKYTARATGKLALYEEACHIRDHAKTPNDYQAAQTLFARLDKYNDIYLVSEKWVTAELFAQSQKCADAKEQALACEQLAQESAAKLKRHSLFTAVAFLAVIALLLCFSKTIAFRQCLANFSSMTGDYQGAYEAYERVYQASGDVDAHNSALHYRYKAAEKQLTGEDEALAYKNYKALAKENYKDSAEKFVNLEKKHLKNTKIGEKVSFADMDWRVLDKKKDQVLLIKDKAIGSLAFDNGEAKAKFVTWATSSARNWLNTTFLEENFLDGERTLLADTAVKNAANPTYGTAAGEDTTDKVFLLSYDEVEKYTEALHETESCWWLRTPGANENTMCFVYRDKTVMDYGYTVWSGNTKITIKPAVWVNVE